MDYKFASQISFPYYILLFYFSVVSYLAIFHLDDLGLDQFSTIIKTLDNSKMFKVRRGTLSSLDMHFM